MGALEDLVARSEIDQLLGRYTAFGDSGRSSDFGALFAADGILDIGGRRQAVGPAGVTRFAEEAKDGMRALAGAHHVSSRLIELTGPGEARAGSVFMFVGPDGPDHWGRYRDRLVLTADGWRFALRKVRFDGFASGSPAPAMIERLART
ncbi:nuclear transport factor 2 family protein [Spirillospora sp. NPDC047279]|uniref:nuclear transport factor 2 family protein n=1 Tax=Spirillospora sp. NPDC047279 TaxID=3155478 RepID=UPI0033CBE19A